MRKILFLLFCLFLSLKGSAQFSGSGSGTESDPYLIFNPIQLNQLRNFLGNSTVHFKLMADIDLKEWINDNNPTEGWQPVGVNSSPFKGILEGNNHTIYDLYINRPDLNDVGLFGCCNGATIQNCTITGNITGSVGTGAFVGSGTDTKLNNLVFTGDVTGGNRTGGIIGSGTDTKLNNLVFTGNVTGGSGTGGIVGACPGIYTNITNAQFSGKTSGKECTGGIVGMINPEQQMFEKNNINNNKAKGDISGLDFTGGIIGKTIMPNDPSIVPIYNSTTDSICFNSFEGSINGKSNVGGLMGFINRPFMMTDSYAIAELKSGEYTGGLIGKVGDFIYPTEEQHIEISSNSSHSTFTNFINNNYAICGIQADGFYVGGIIGGEYSSDGSEHDIYFRGEYNYPYHLFVTITTSLTNNYFNGTLQGIDKVGGIVGDSKFTNIIKNYSRADIYGKNDVGGIVGYTNSSTVKSNFAINSNINAIESNIGRIYGSGTGTFGASGTTEANMALLTTNISLNGVVQDVNDSEQHGTNIGENTLKIKATYQGMGWDFTGDWKIQETECFPYKTKQTAPPLIESGALAGNTKISGKSVDGGKVFIKIGDKIYETNCIQNKWEVTTDALQAGEKIEVYAIADGKSQSYRSTQHVKHTGKGTAEEPYLIFTAEDLAFINGHGFYKLMQDIDLTAWINKNSPIKGWQPLGRNSAVMSHFDGNNHVISGLWINTQDDYTGLFSNCSKATIENLTVNVAEGKNITGGNHTGILVGKTIGCTINNCKVIGDVKGNDFVGSLVGSANSTSISKCFAKGNVEGTGIAGGLIGQCTEAPVTRSSFVGNVKSDIAGGLIGCTDTSVSLSFCNGININGKSIAGGLTGKALTGSSISNCYSTADVTATPYVAGLVGYNYGSISKCYASGNLRGTNVGAGIVGYNDGAGATTSECLALNKIINVSDAKGIAMRVIGGYKNGAPDPVDNNFAFMEMAVSVNNVPQKIYDDILNGKAKTEAELKQAATYELLGWNMKNVWTIDGGLAYPTLRENASEDKPGEGGGDQPGEGGGTDPEIVDSPNTIVLNDMAANCGSTITLPINMVNKDQITSFQFDIYLPDGITVNKYEDGYDMIDVASDRTSTRLHTVASQVQADGAIRVLCYSTSNAVFKGNEGTVLNAVLNVSPELADGDYTVLVKNVVLSTPDTKRIVAPNAKSVIKVSSYTIGDVNNDHIIDITDISCVVSFIIGTANEGLIEKAADVTQDNIIDVVDITGLVNMILNKPATATYAMADEDINEDINSMASLDLEPYSINNDGENEINVLMNNQGVDITGLQFDLSLPEGVTLKTNEDGFMGINLGSRTNARSHSLACRQISEGTYRFVVYSASNKLFNGNNGDVLALNLCTDANVCASEEIILKNIVMSTPNAKRITAEDKTCIVTFNNTTGIDNITESLSFPADIYTVEGTLVKKNAKNMNGLAKGVYIINKQKVIK